MMEWLVIISDFLTNGLRLILGLYLLARLMDVELDRKEIGFSALGSVLVTLLDVAGLPVMICTPNTGCPVLGVHIRAARLRQSFYLCPFVLYLF